ncbi:MAG: nucleotidyltransferase domain-containing protein [Pseudobutyrivibrio sp.]|nr:nucleotidyltransferase domain-containing protein [Pseudobutyrivibrio sp.]
MGKVSNIDKINPIKRKYVEQIVTDINGNEYVQKVVIFGSSIREDCTENSDVDIAIQWTENCYDDDYVLKPFTLPIYRIISRTTKGNNDVVCIGYEGELKSEIEKGVTVYEL